MKKSALKRELRSLRRQMIKKLRRKPKATPVAPLTSSSPLAVVGGRPQRKRINEQLMARARGKVAKSLDSKQPAQFAPWTPPPGVLPANVKPIAMDSAQTAAMVAWAQSSMGAYWAEGLTFMGYAELSNLTVRPEYRVISEVIATECTRKWITFQATDDERSGQEEDGVLEASEELPDGAKAGTGEEATTEEDLDADPAETEATAAEVPEDREDEESRRLAGDAFPGQEPQSPEMAEGFEKLQQAKAEKEEAKNAMAKERAAHLAAKDGKEDRIKELTKEFDRLCVRDLFAKIIQFDGFFGRAHLYIDTDQGASREELMTDIGDGANDVTKAKFKKGSLKRLAVVEPVWVYPQQYNSSDPLSPDWYAPSQWFVMAKQLHASRLLTFVGRPVPDILKPAYAFGGLSLSQIAKPYVDNWLQTRQSVNDIIKAFSVMVLKTDLTAILQDSGGSGDSLFDRLDLFNSLRDNRSVFALDKEGEDFANVSAQLTNLDKLQAQAQEHMAAVSRIPLVKLLGVSPAGLNASSEGELRAFYDTIHSYQEFFIRPNLTRIMHFAMMNLWGEVDEDITFKFEPLWSLSEKEEAEVRKMNAETDDIYVNGVSAIHPEEVRKRLASDPESPYEGIEVADVPDAPVEESPFSRMVASGEESEPFGGASGGASGGKTRIGKSDDDEFGKEPARVAAVSIPKPSIKRN